MFAALEAWFSTPSSCCGDRRSLGSRGGGSGQQTPICSLAPSSLNHLQALWNSPSYCFSDRKCGIEPWQQVESISQQPARLEKAAAPAAGATQSTQVSNSSGPPSQAHATTPEQNGAHAFFEEEGYSNGPAAKALHREEVPLPEGISMHDREGLYCRSRESGRDHRRSGDKNSQEEGQLAAIRGLIHALRTEKERAKSDKEVHSVEDREFISDRIKEALGDMKNASRSRVSSHITQAHSSGSQLTLTPKLRSERSQRQTEQSPQHGGFVAMADSNFSMVGSMSSASIAPSRPQASADENEDSDDEDNWNKKWQQKKENKENTKIKDIVDRINTTVADIPVDVSAKDEESDKYKETCRENIEEYQSIVRERLKKLGIEESDLHFHETQSLGAAVVDTILQYHRHCHDVGKPFAFLADTGGGDGEGNEGGEMMDRVQNEIDMLSDKKTKLDKAKGRLNRKNAFRESPRRAEGSPSAEAEPLSPTPSPSKTLSERFRLSEGWTKATSTLRSSWK